MKSNIYKTEFQYLKSILMIDLKYNKIMHLDGNLLQSCVNLKELCLFGNNLSQNDFTLNIVDLVDLDINNIFSVLCNSDN